MTLLDLTNGYATLGRGGLRRRPALFLDERSDAVRVLGCRGRAPWSATFFPRGIAGRTAGRIAAKSDLPWFMWKTGTSSGRRDAWAVGHNQRYAIGVWIGRFLRHGFSAVRGSRDRRAAAGLVVRLARGAFARARRPRRNASRCCIRCRPPAEVAGNLRIVSPSAGARYVALAGQTVVCPRATRLGGVSWVPQRRLAPGRSRSTPFAGARAVRVALRGRGRGSGPTSSSWSSTSSRTLRVQ